MRLFVALPLSEEARRSLGERIAELRQWAPPARWVPVRNLHLTLRFLGEIPPDRVPALGEVLRDGFAAHRPLRLRLRDGGCFPPRRPARVAWVGFEEAPALVDLQVEVARAVEDELGLATERRSFHPHLTLARPRRPWPRAVVDRWCAALAGPHGPSFDVGEGDLMRSRLGSGGARHESLGTYPLGGTVSGL